MNYEEYTPAIRLGGGLIPSGSGNFPVARACDILMPDGSRLDVYLKNNNADAQDTTWVIKDTPDVTSMPDRGFEVLFTSNGVEYKKMVGSESSNVLLLIYMANAGGTGLIVYRSDTGWTEEAYKEITLQGSITDQVLLNWLKANATLRGSNGGLPPYTEADNGKFLQIVDGSPAWVLIEDGDEVEY